MSQPLDEQLSFLYNVPTLGGKYSDKYEEIVGMYLIDQQIMNPDEAELHLKNRGICETKHAQIKNIVKFDVKGYRADSRELYTLMALRRFKGNTKLFIKD